MALSLMRKIPDKSKDFALVITLRISCMNKKYQDPEEYAIATFQQITGEETCDLFDLLGKKFFSGITSSIRGIKVIVDFDVDNVTPYKSTKLFISLSQSTSLDSCVLSGEFSINYIKLLPSTLRVKELE